MGNPPAPLASPNSLREMHDSAARNPGHKGIHPGLGPVAFRGRCKLSFKILLYLEWYTFNHRSLKILTSFHFIDPFYRFPQSHLSMQILVRKTFIFVSTSCFPEHMPENREFFEVTRPQIEKSFSMLIIALLFMLVVSWNTAAYTFHRKQYLLVVGHVFVYLLISTAP